MAHKTEIQTLLAAARRGSFPALLAAADYWQEHAAGSRPDEFSAFNWRELLAQSARHVRPDWHDAHRMSRLESMARWFRDFARCTSQLHGNCWKIPRPLSDRHPAWDWCKDMAQALLKHARTLEAARAPAEAAE